MGNMSKTRLEAYKLWNPPDQEPGRQYIIMWAPQRLCKPLALCIWSGDVHAKVEQILSGHVAQLTVVGSQPVAIFRPVWTPEQVIQNIRELQHIDPTLFQLTLPVIEPGSRLELKTSGVIDAVVIIVKEIDENYI